MQRRKSRVTTVSIPADMDKELARIAEFESSSVSSIIRRALKLYFLHRDVTGSDVPVTDAPAHANTSDSAA